MPIHIGVRLDHIEDISYSFALSQDRVRSNAADDDAPTITKMAAKRLIKELAQYRKDPSPAISNLEPANDDDDLFNLHATLKGPEGTAYEGQ